MPAAHPGARPPAAHGRRRGGCRHGHDRRADPDGGVHGPRPARHPAHPAVRRRPRHGRGSLSLGGHPHRRTRSRFVLTRSRFVLRFVLHVAAAARTPAAAGYRPAHGFAAEPAQRRAGGYRTRIRLRRAHGVWLPVRPLPAIPVRPVTGLSEVVADRLGRAQRQAAGRVPTPVLPNRTARQGRAAPRAVSAAGGRAVAVPMRLEAVGWAWRRAWHREIQPGWPRDRSSARVPTS